MDIGKHLSYIIAFACLVLSCKAQITPLWQADPDAPDGSYFKDLDNDLDNFEGVWESDNNGTTLTLDLRKIENIENGTFNKSEDILVGEYKYVEDGQTIMDYLPLLDDPTIIGHKHYVSGNLLMANYHRPPCNNCQPDDRRLMLFWIDPEKRNLRSSSVLRRFQENGVEKLEMRHYLTYGEGSDQDLIPRIPYQTYIMTLQ
ncbi:DUF6705 family protein [Dokdonia sp. Asnod2-E02]|uniref:DUF6705 family protein n=1 Tax=Dokdonia sp. Asnod2-E02 TaxID=3160574 RepID=UPI00386D7615